MSIFTDMVNMGSGDVPFDRTAVSSKASLHWTGKKWELIEESTDSVVSPVGITRSSDVVARPFIDDVSYTFGILVTKGSGDSVIVTKNDKKATVRHEAYIKAIVDSGLANTDKFIKKFVDFISNDPYGKLIEGKDQAGVDAVNKILLKAVGAIRVCENGDALAEIHADKFAVSTLGKVRCSVTGKLSPILDCKAETLRGVPGAVPSLITLSCNTSEFPSVCNYGFDNMDGSPVSSVSQTLITRNLQKLFKDPKTRIKIPNSNGISYLFNYEKATDLQKGMVSAILNTPYKVENLEAFGIDDEETDVVADYATEEKKVSCEDIVHQKYVSLHKGTVFTAKQKGKITVYRIHAVQGRWSCTNTFQLDLGQLFANIDRWYADTVTDTAMAGAAHSIDKLLRSSIADNGSYLSRDYENLMQSILLGKEISSEIYRRVLYRAAISQRSTKSKLSTKKCQYSLIRACYNSVARNHNRKELTDMLDTSNKSYAYNLGRLLAIGDYVQFSVHKAKANSPISGRMDKRATLRPTECIAELLNRIKVYQDQMSGRADKNWVVVKSEKLVGEVSANLNVPHPTSLSMDEQAEMRIAYYQQKNEFYNNNKNNN